MDKKINIMCVFSLLIFYAVFLGFFVFFDAAIRPYFYFYIILYMIFIMIFSYFNSKYCDRVSLCFWSMFFVFFSSTNYSPSGIFIPTAILLLSLKTCIMKCFFEISYQISQDNRLKFKTTIQFKEYILDKIMKKIIVNNSKLAISLLFLTFTLNLLLGHIGLLATDFYDDSRLLLKDILSNIGVQVDFILKYPLHRMTHYSAYTVYLNILFYLKIISIFTLIGIIFFPKYSEIKYAFKNKLLRIYLNKLKKMTFLYSIFIFIICEILEITLMYLSYNGIYINGEIINDKNIFNDMILKYIVLDIFSFLFLIGLTNYKNRLRIFKKRYILTIMVFTFIMLLYTKNLFTSFNMYINSIFIVACGFLGVSILSKISDLIMGLNLSRLIVIFTIQLYFFIFLMLFNEFIIWKNYFIFLIVVNIVLFSKNNKKLELR